MTPLCPLCTAVRIGLPFAGVASESAMPDGLRLQPPAAFQCCAARRKSQAHVLQLQLPLLPVRVVLLVRWLLVASARRARLPCSRQLLVVLLVQPKEATLAADERPHPAA